MHPYKRKVYLIGYFIFLIGLLLDYLFVPTESFYNVLWVLIGFFMVFNIYLFLLKPKKNKQM